MSSYIDHRIEIAEGDRCFKSGRYVDANQHYDQALRHVPDSEEALLPKSRALRMLKKYTESIRCLNRWLEINDNYVAYVEKGITLVIQNKHTDAVECFEKGRFALLLISEAQFFYAHALFGTREYQKCLKELDLCVCNKDVKKLKKECRKRLGQTPKWMFWHRP